ncbi:MAG: polyprenol monophosphomannose synthase [Verrucomicrobiae bacterium]|nr:polyprenol monophosphomannose synthase [Verrucomicrobiae bacterium]
MPVEKMLIVIPTLNERENLQTLVPYLRQHQPAAHVLFIDDASRDGTPDFVKNHPDFGTHLFMIERPGKMGLGTAYVAGFEWALARDYALIMEMDADLSHDPKVIPEFQKAISQGADLVIGSRYIHGVRVLNWPIGRLFLSLGAAEYVKWITGMPVTDPTGGFKCFRRHVLESIDLSSVRSNGYSFQIEVNYRVWSRGFRITEIPIIFEDRHLGQSKMSASITREAIWMVWKIAAQNRFRRTPPESPHHPLP